MFRFSTKVSVSARLPDTLLSKISTDDIEFYGGGGVVDLTFSALKVVREEADGMGSRERQRNRTENDLRIGSRSLDNYRA